MSKKLMSRPWVQEILAFAGVLYIEAVRYSIRWEVRNNEYIENVLDNDTPILGVVWHGRVLMALQGWYRKRHRMVALASRSREGDLGSRLARWYNVVLVRGSSHNKAKPEKFKGGGVAYREMKRLIEEGMSGVITPDGPRGPRMRAGYGAVRMARDTGVPIVPFTWSTRRKTVLTKAWDRHCLPHFFTKGVIIWGDPIHVSKDATQEDLEAARQLLEDRMIAITREADEAVGAEVIEPDESERPRADTGGAPA